MALQWFNRLQDTVLIVHNLHLFLESPGSGAGYTERRSSLESHRLLLGNDFSPMIQMGPEVEKFFHVIDLPLPDEEELFNLQNELGKVHNIK